MVRITFQSTINGKIPGGKSTKLFRGWNMALDGTKRGKRDAGSQWIMVHKILGKGGLWNMVPTKDGYWNIVF